MNEHEKDRIAAAFNQLRPDWPVKSLRTLLDRDTLTDRPRRDVVVALGWVACETNTATPARVLESGPWWKAAAIEGAATHREPFDAATFCGTCGMSKARCESYWRPTGDAERDLEEGRHPFEAVAHSKRRKGAVDVTPVIAEMKGHLEPMRERPEDRPTVHTPQGDAVRAELGTVGREVPGE